MILPHGFKKIRLCIPIPFCPAANERWRKLATIFFDYYAAVYHATAFFYLKIRFLRLLTSRRLDNYDFQFWLGKVEYV